MSYRPTGVSLKEIILPGEIMDKIGYECKKLVIEYRNIRV